MIEIFITSYKPTVRTLMCMNSIMMTVKQPYTLTILSTKGSAAYNKNLAFSRSQTGRFILVDDDLLFKCKGWASRLMQSLEGTVGASIVGGRVLFDCGTKSIGFQAPNSALMDNIRVTGCMLAIMDVGIRYDEIYKVSQGDDIDFCFQNKSKGYRVLCDTRVTAFHPKIIDYKTDYHARNAKRAYSKWGKDDYLKWGRDPKEFKVVKQY